VVAALLLTMLLSLLLHLLLGWQWTILAALPIGFFRPRRAWIIGAAGVALGWSILIGYSLVVAARPTLRMLQFVGSLFGNLPAPAVVAVTALVGGILGLLGAWIGRSAADLRERWARTAAPP